MNASAVEGIERVGIALLHSLWQGALVGCALLVALPLLRRAGSQSRYLVCCAALTLMLALPIATFYAAPAGQIAQNGRLERESALASSAAAALETAASLLPEELPADIFGGDPATAEKDDASLAAPAPESSKTPALGGPRWLSPRGETLLLAMVAAWGAGVLLLSCRLAGGYIAAARLARRLIEPLDEFWQVRCRRLMERLGLRIRVELLQSACVDVPVVIGCFRPVILVPLALVTGLPASQLESILAHELAHVRRYDFLVNAVQCVIETLLFYHPCAWWISARIRAEREQCCDEMAIWACGDAATYARALTGLEELRTPTRLAIALTGGGSLLSRIRRIAGQRRASDVVGGWLAGMLAVVLPLVAGGAWAFGRNVPDVAGRDGVLVVGASPFEDSDEALFRDALAVTDDLASTLSKVSDARSAGAVAEQLVKLSRRHADVDRRLRRRRRSMGVEADQAFAQRWAQRTEESGKRLKAEVARVQQTPGAVDALRSSILFEVIGLRGGAEAAPGASELVEPPRQLWAVSKPAFAGSPFVDPSVDPLERMIEKHGLQQMVTVVVAGLPGDVYDYVYNHLRGLAPNLSYSGSGRGDMVTVRLAPIGDLDFFASRIELGQVTVDREQRLIRVQADHSRFPQPLGRSRDSQQAAAIQAAANGENQALRHTSAKALAAVEDERMAEQLCESLLRHDRGAMETLVGLGSVAEPAVAKRVQNADRRVRRDALLVLKKIATEASLPALLPALADPDLGNRDLAWQTICRVPGLARHNRVIEAAAASLERHPEQAAKWLAVIGPVAEHAVSPYLRHDDAEVRFQAANVLKAIGTADSLTELERLADDVEIIASAAKAARDAIDRRQTR